CCYGQAADLELIRADIRRVGFTPSRVYVRARNHHIHNGYREYQFTRTEEWFKVVGSGFALLLACLGAPVGNKASQEYEVPGWLPRAPLWQQRLFLAGLFGAELTTPREISGHGTILGQPTLSMNKRPEYVAGGRRFLEGLSAMLSRFGVRTQSILV